MNQLSSLRKQQLSFWFYPFRTDTRPYSLSSVIHYFSFLEPFEKKHTGGGFSEWLQLKRPQFHLWLDGVS